MRTLRKPTSVNITARSGSGVSTKSFCPVTLKYTAHAAARLERAAVIVQPDAADEADEAVGDPRRQLAAEFPVHPVLAPAAHHVATGFQVREELLDVRRIVLQISVHGNDDVAPGVLD